MFAADVTVRAGQLEVELIEIGEVQAIESRSVSAPMEWREALQIIEIVDEGSQVEAGEVLVRFDDGFLAAEIDQVTSSIEEGEAEVQRIVASQASRRLTMQNTVRRAEFTVEQTTLNLEKIQFESESKRLDTELALKKARVSLREAEAKLDAQAVLDSLELARAELKVTLARAKLEEEQLRATEMELRAPIGGLAVYGEKGWGPDRRKVRLGDEIHAGTKVIHIPNLDRMEVMFWVHEVDREKLNIGTAGSVTLESDPDRKFEASVTHIGRLALPPESDSKVRRFEVRARIHGADPALKPGSTATVQLELQSPAGLLVESNAVFEIDGAPCVFPRAQWPEPVFVELGAASLFHHQVRNGVTEGAVLATVPPAREDVRPLGASTYERRTLGEEAQP